MSDVTSTYHLRAAEPRDVPAIVGLIAELAEFEHLSHLMQATPDTLAPHLFGPQPVARCLVAELRQAPGLPGAPEASNQAAPVVAFALFFRNFSTFLAKPGLYLEDLYVQPAHRGAGIGQALLTRLAELAVAEGCGRFEWCVLDWNERAIRFYEKVGAALLPEWRLCRLTGRALAQLGQG